MEPGRAQVQILHEWDSCCFRAGGLHDNVRDYNVAVRGELRRAAAAAAASSSASAAAADGAGAAAGFMQTVVTAGNYHQINVRDKVIVAVCVEWLRKCVCCVAWRARRCLLSLFFGCCC